MKLILSAAALLAALSVPVVAEEVAPAAAQAQAQTATVQEIVPTATEPAMSEAQPAAVSGSPSQSAAEGGGCGHAKKAVYLTP
jgi:uncharacterized low-complexity protein